MSWGNPQTVNDHFYQALLKLFACPYKAALDLRQLAYSQKLLSTKSLSCPVISVGNLTVGGTGKTPIIIDLAANLLANKIKVGILSRGYGRHENNRCITVGNGQGAFASLAQSGDEALMMAKMLPEAVVIVDPDRVAAGEKAIREFKCQVLLLDDGFQHWRLQRDGNIVLIDYADDPNKDALLPAGRLREPLSALSRATHIVITKVPEDYNQEKLDYLKKLAHTYGPQAKVSSCRFANCSIEQFLSGSWQVREMDILNNMPVVAFCAIARPEGFFKMVKKSGANVVRRISFPDHHHYSAGDLANLGQAFKRSGAKFLVTTRKDLIKLDGADLTPQLLAINQSIEWLEGAPDIMSWSQVQLPAHNL